MSDPTIIGDATLHCGDCLEVMAGMDADSVDAIVTDPPYALVGASRNGSSQPGDMNTPYGRSGPSKKKRGFMGKEWDGELPSVETWQEALRVAKPGAHLLAFGGTRTFHRLAVAIEDAGWEIRDTVMWVHGQGFPKSLAIDKALDRMAGAERDVVGVRSDGRGASPQKLQNHGKGDTGIGHMDGSKQVYNETAPATPAARQWAGWGTALKPAWEPVIVARKPLRGTVAENVLRYGTGGLNVDGCRVGTESTIRPDNSQPFSKNGVRDDNGRSALNRSSSGSESGRWPSNLIHDGSAEVVGLFPVTTTHPGVIRKPGGIGHIQYAPSRKVGTVVSEGNTGSAARFFQCCPFEAGDYDPLFYTGKATKKDRDAGCEGLEAQRTTFAAGTGLRNNSDGTPRNNEPSNRNHHPTVKPLSLMRYLVRLVTPPKVVDMVCLSCSNGNDKQAKGINNDRSQKTEDMRAMREALPQQTQGESVLLGTVPAPGKGHPPDAMPSMRANGDESQTDVLLPEVREQGTCEAKTAKDMRTMRQDVSADVGSSGARPVKAVLQPTVQGDMERDKEKKTVHDERARIPDAIQAGAPNGEQGWVCHGTPSFNGGTHRADVACVGGSASHQRGQGGQQVGKPDCDDARDTQPPCKRGQAHGDRVSALCGQDKIEQRCPKCGGKLTPIERPGIILDPFMGSGSTGKAALLEGFRFTGIDLDPEHVAIAKARLEHIQCKQGLFADAS